MAVAATRSGKPKAQADPPTRDALVAAAKAWLHQRGVPHFGEKPEDRKLHFEVILGFAALYGAFGAPTDEISRAGDIAVAVGIVLVGLAAAAVYRRRAKPGLTSLPPPGWMNEMLLVAILVAPVANVVGTGDVRTATLEALAVTLLLYALIVAMTPVGAFRILVWSIRHPFREARQTATVLAGAIPFLLLTLAFMLLTNEYWVVASNLDTSELIWTLSLFGFLALIVFVFEAVRIEKAAEFSDWRAVRRAMRAESTPPPPAIDALVNEFIDHAPDAGTHLRGWLKARLEAVAAADPDDEPDIARELELLRDGAVSQKDRVDFLRVSRWPPRPPIEEVRKLGPLERVNITIVVSFALSVQMLAVSLVMGAFFLIFGRIVVDAGTMKAWEVASHPGWLGWTQEHWEVSALLAAFAGLSYAVSVVLFKDVRALFLAELDRKVTQRLAVRALYCGLNPDPRAVTTGGCDRRGRGP